MKQLLGAALILAALALGVSGCKQAPARQGVVLPPPESCALSAGG